MRAFLDTPCDLSCTSWWFSSICCPPDRVNDVECPRTKDDERVHTAPALPSTHLEVISYHTIARLIYISRRMVSRTQGPSRLTVLPIPLQRY